MQVLTGETRTSRRGREPDDPGRSYEFLLLTVQNVDRADLDRMPAAAAIGSRVLRENLLHVPASGYAFDLEIRNDEETYQSIGAVCVGWRVDHPGGRSDDSLRSRRREVAAAHRSGLLDDAGRSKADFRLQMKPATRRLSALLDSGYLSSDDLQMDVLFAHWYEQRTQEPVLTPVSADGDPRSWEQMHIRFTPHSRRRDFYVSDLLRDDSS